MIASRAVISRLVVVALLSGAGAHPTFASDLPAIKVSAQNKVAACATPGRLMAFVKNRNEKLDPRFDTIATEYMKHGEDIGLRWDVAFFQMVVETGSLKFGGDVKPAQNNFAGLGATGNGERGESFKDVSTGVRAHLEHLAMYSGEKLANPVAERTRKVQEWGVLTEWQKTIKGPMTFSQLAKKWAPPARKYAQEIESVLETFTDGACKSADPRPELIAAARAGRGSAQTVDVASAAAATGAAKDQADAEQSAAAVAPAKTVGTELAKRANDDARSEGTAQRSSLGAGAVAKQAKGAKSSNTPVDTAVLPNTLNSAKPEVAEAGAEKGSVSKASVTGAAKATKPTTSTAGCNVFTASYGGGKAIIIKAVAGDSINYTVLDVNEGAEQREAEAYIQAYAPGGKTVGEFKTPTAALDKAFELCPEN
jgi:hypothetical protein